MTPYLPADSIGGQNNRACRSRAPRAIVGTPGGGRRWTLGPRCDRSDTVSPPSARLPPSFANHLGRVVEAEAPRPRPYAKKATCHTFRALVCNAPSGRTVTTSAPFRKLLGYRDV